MAGPALSTSQQHGLLSQNCLIGLTSFVLILVVAYPWIIAVSGIAFVIGFSCFERVDRFLKVSITTGRFGTNVREYFKDYINDEANQNRHVIKEATADPLRDYLEFEESKKQQSQSQEGGSDGGSKHGIQVLHSLVIPESISSNRSSPERARSARESPVHSLSAASSRRVSEDVNSGLGGGHSRRESNKSPSPSKSKASTPSPSLALSSEISSLRVDQEFRVDEKVDKAFGRLFTNILNYYISTEWAPYETRRQLRVSFKQLLTSVGEQLNKKLLVRKGDSEYPPLVKITRQKLVPLLLYYVEKALSRGLSSDNVDDPIISKDGRRRLVLKIRKFCRQISERFLNKDDQNCKLWMELFTSVLADGVLVNVMELGRDMLPELFEELVTNFKKMKTKPRASVSHWHTPSPSPAKSVVSSSSRGDVDHHFMDPLSDNYPEETLVSQQKEDTASVKSDVFLTAECLVIEPSKEATKTSEKVPFLLDSFLDPPFNLEKPDPIVSRWRPTLKDIVSETDLLYPLIQYMKHIGGQQSLAYLQGVLDDYPQEGDPYCRRVLELEYLPGFCRSSLLLETMGLNRVEMALEVGTDLLNMRRSSSGHARSASYGGPTSSFREFLRIEQGIVDGLPLTESSSNLSSLSSTTSEQSVVGTGSSTTGATLPGAGAIEPSLTFKRRPHLEMYIAKFMKSTTKSWKQYYDPLADKGDPAKRMGIDAKSYAEWDHPEVNSRVRIHATNEDIYDSLIEVVTTLIRDNPVASPFLSGLSHFLKPYLMPIFDSQIDKNLHQVLSMDLLIIVIDLIADVYDESPEKDDIDIGKCGSSENKMNVKSGLSDDNLSNPEDDTSQLHNSSCTTCDPGLKSTIESFLLRLSEFFVLNLIDLDYFVKCCAKNREYIFLFFVDLLDIVVSEIVEK